MPKKKKKEKVPLTPEEKKAKKAEKKRLAALKREERKRQIVHDELDREIKYGALTVKMHEAKWKKMLIKISLPKIREQLIYDWQTFMRVIDAKDFTISLRMDELDMAEEQHMRLLREHVESIEKHMKLCTGLLEDLRADFDKDLEDLLGAANVQTEMLTKSFQEDELLMRVILYALGCIRRENEKFLRGDFISKYDEEASRYQDVLMLEKGRRENWFSNILNETTGFINVFMAETKQRRKEYNELYAQDLEIREANAERLMKIMKMINRVRRLKLKFEVIHKEREVLLNELRMRKNFFKGIFEEFKAIVLEQNHKLTQFFINLTHSYGEFFDFLKKFEKKGRDILRMYSLCMKLETECEKVFPLPLMNPCMTKKEEKHMRQEMETAVDDICVPHDKFGGELPGLVTFWNKVAQANLVLVQLLEERCCLEAENARLRRSIHKYCQCLQCPSFPPIHTQGRKKQITAIDGRLEMMKYNKQCF